MFKPGQRVVYIGGNTNPDILEPEINEIVTIYSTCIFFRNHYKIKEYMDSKDGNYQAFSADELRPLDESFATETLERISQDIKEEELVEVEGKWRTLEHINN